MTSRKQLHLKTDEIAEAAFDAGKWIEHNWRRAVAYAGVVAGIVLIAAVWFWMAAEKRAKAEALLADAQNQYELAAVNRFSNEDELAAVLELFDEVIAKSGGSGAGQIARFYRGATQSHMGRHDAAIESLEPVTYSSGTPSTVLSSAEALLANVYVEAGQADKAIAFLKDVAEMGDPHLPAEQAWLQLGRIHRDQGDVTQARRVWQRVASGFQRTTAGDEAQQLIDALPL